MPFTNPSTATTLQPEVDYFAWPCILGEKYPPTLTTVTYGQASGMPALTTPSTGNVVWPFMPRIGPAQSALGAVTMSFRLRISAPITSDSDSVTVTLGGSVRIVFTFSFVVGGTSAQLFTAAGSSTVVSWAVGDWHTVAVSVDAAGNASWRIDDAVQPAPPAGDTLANTTLQPKLATAVPLGGWTVGLSQMRIAWS